MYETINQIQKNRPTLKQYIKDRVPTAGKTRKLLSEVFEYNNYKFRETKKDYFDKLQAAYWTKNKDKIKKMKQDKIQSKRFKNPKTTLGEFRILNNSITKIDPLPGIGDEISINSSREKVSFNDLTQNIDIDFKVARKKYLIEQMFKNPNMPLNERKILLTQLLKEFNPSVKTEDAQTFSYKAQLYKFLI